MSVILQVENISKQYRLGTVGTGTLTHDLNRWWHGVRGKEDPYLKIGEVNDRSTQATSDYVWALQDINFEVQPGEVLGIIGKNGAGKSTLLKILSRVTAPTTGVIRTRGRIASLLEVGTGFHPELTGRENIYMNGAILGMTKREINAKLDEIIAFSGCERYIDTPVKRYSSGMTVRLGFAVAAHLEPDILVVDEVLAVGDAEFQKKAIGKMQDISKTGGRTVLFVSHDMTAITALTSSVIILKNGRCTNKMPADLAIAHYLKQNSYNTYDLSNRKSEGELFIEGITLNEKNNLNIQIQSGKKLKMRFKLNQFISVDSVNTIALYVVFRNELNFPVFTVSNRYDTDFKVKTDNAIRFIECELPSFCLTEGHFKGTTWMSYKGGFCDEITDAFQVQVVSSDYFKTGQMPVSRKHGSYLINQFWRAL